MRASGTLLCVAAAAAFGAMAVFGRLAYDQGVTVGTLLEARFAIAALLLWAIVGVGAAGREAVPWPPRRDVALALGLGAFGYAAQAAAYFAALQRIDASLLSLLVYTFPAMVTVAAIVLGRERADRRRLGALALASLGLVLILAGAGTGALDPVGTLLGLGAAVLYSAYILVSAGVAGRMSVRLLSALVCTGATGTLTVGSLALGQLRPGVVTAQGWLWLVALAAVSTVGAIGLFFAGLRRVGPTTAAIVSTVEPLVTVVLALLVLGETLAPVQVAGGALILAAVLALHLGASGRPRRRRGGRAGRRPGAAPRARGRRARGRSSGAASPRAPTASR